MRLVVDREAGSVRLEFGESIVERGDALADGVTALFDGAGRVSALQVERVDPSALREVTLVLAGAGGSAPADAATPQRAATPRPSAPASTPYTGPLTWDAEAEAAMARIPFFSRGRHRLAASALARREGLDRVTVAVIDAVGR